ncbi:hypothetical protein FRC10_007845 [Ceratobasidium sp. 414]|nr:hypothetical protein FRC10_007845 [Ceratobasidium sp. 414]
MVQTAFTSRPGGHEFPRPTKTNGYSSLVNCWHHNAYRQQDVGYQFDKVGQEHKPEWEATPTILGEVHTQYRGRGLTKAKAQEASAEKIAKSGHCVSL